MAQRIVSLGLSQFIEKPHPLVVLAADYWCAYPPELAGERAEWAEAYAIRKCKEQGLDLPAWALRGK